MNKKSSHKKTSKHRKQQTNGSQNKQKIDKPKKQYPRKKKKKIQPKRKNSRKKNNKKKNKRGRFIKRLFLELISAVILTSVLIWLISIVTFTFVKIDGYAMMPSLAAKETVFVSKLSEKKRFKLVAIKLADRKEIIIRRIVGMPGENIRYDKDRLYINNEAVEEKFIAEEIQQADISGSFYTKDFTSEQLFNENMIPKGKYLILGDNRPYSTDSRFYGLIDEKEIIGVVTMRIFPLHKMTKF